VRSHGFNYSLDIIYMVPCFHFILVFIRTAFVLLAIEIDTDSPKGVTDAISSRKRIRLVKRPRAFATECVAFRWSFSRPMSVAWRPIGGSRYINRKGGRSFRDFFPMWYTEREDAPPRADARREPIVPLGYMPQPDRPSFAKVILLRQS